MHISISSLLISLTSATLLIVLNQLFLRTRRIRQTFRVGLFYALMITASVRLLLPVEFIYTRTLASKHVLPYLYRFGRQQIAVSARHGLSVFAVLAVV